MSSFGDQAFVFALQISRVQNWGLVPRAIKMNTHD